MGVIYNQGEVLVADFACPFCGSWYVDEDGDEYEPSLSIRIRCEGCDKVFFIRKNVRVSFEVKEYPMRAEV